MIIACPQCQSRYRINPPSGKPQARVKCPSCQHLFTISLLEPPASSEPASVPPPPPPQAGEPVRPLVLVVDDARFFREMIRDLLADLPIRLETAGDGEEALRLIRELHPAMLLLDLNIPGLSGKDLIAQVRKDPACQSLRILAMSGVERGEEAAHDVRRLGADDFINKSFKPLDLQNRIRHILGL